MKLILLLSTLIFSLSYSQILEEENFDSRPLGIITDWYTTGDTPVLEVVQNVLPYDRVLKITQPYNHMPSVSTIKKSENFAQLWSNRQQGNNIFKAEVDIKNFVAYYEGYLGLYNDNNKIVVGLTAPGLIDDKIYGVATVRKKSNNSIVRFRTPPLGNYADFTKVTYTYNYDTGEVTWQSPSTAFSLNISNTEYDVIPYQNLLEHKIDIQLSHQASGKITIDNYKTEAVSTYNLNVKNNILENQKLIIYPNPSSDYISITTKNILKIEILNLNGNLINNIPIKSSRIDISSLPPGLYILKITTNNAILTDKFIKI